MAENTAIEWCDKTFNPWRGCTHALLPDGTTHPGCLNCYAEAGSKRAPKTLGVWGPDGNRVVAAESYWQLPFKWNKVAEKSGVRLKVFCASFADIFEDWDGEMEQVGGGAHYTKDGDPSRMVPNSLAVGTDMDGYHYTRFSDVRARLFRLIDDTPNLDWIILTKRPDNVRRMWPRYTYDACATGDCPHDRQSECRVELYRENVWLLTSISDQQSADAMIPPLLECRDLVPVLGLSVEPLVGPIDLEPYIMTYVTDGGDVGYMARPRKPFIDWVIVGGESGPHARPMHPAWARSLRDQCQAAGVAYFFKQFGEWYPIHGTGRPSRDEDSEQSPFCWVSRDGGVSQSGCEPDALMLKIGKKAAGRTLDGRTWDEFPQVAGVPHA